MRRRLTRAGRLALVVRAQVATTRADRARERAALVERRVRPLTEAFDRFGDLHGRDPDLEAPADAAALGRLIDRAGGHEVSWEMVAEAAGLTGDLGRLECEAAEALRALAEAWGGDGRTVREWVGADDATIDRAVAQALAEAA